MHALESQLHHCGRSIAKFSVEVKSKTGVIWCSYPRILCYSTRTFSRWRLLFASPRTMLISSERVSAIGDRTSACCCALGLAQIWQWVNGSSMLDGSHGAIGQGSIGHMGSWVNGSWVPWVMGHFERPIDISGLEQ